MVLPSVPVYLDPPNWNQQPQALQPGSSRVAAGGGGSNEVPKIPPGLATPHPDGPLSGSVSRSVSMAERALLAKIPQAEPALKCPRCDSSNTKFCYFNNYSLSQPRHFCKTCRRYWTRGGALRNVPVGGGCRRNMRSKSGGGSSSKLTSGATSDRQVGASSSSLAAGTSAAAGATTSSGMPLQHHMQFLASLHPLPDYVTQSQGLIFGRIQQPDAGDYHVGSASGGLENLRVVHQQMQKLPNFLRTLEPPPSLAAAPVTGPYSLVGEDDPMEGGLLMRHAPMKAPHSGLITQLVKMEDHNVQGLNFPRHYLSAQHNIDNFWNTAGSSGGENNGSGAGGSGWTADVPGFSTSATGNLL